MSYENFDWPDSAIYPKNQEKFLPDLSKKQKNANITEENSSNERDAKHSPVRGDDIIVPETSQKDERNENLSSKGWKYNLRASPKPKYSEDLRY